MYFQLYCDHQDIAQWLALTINLFVPKCMEDRELLDKLWDF